MRNIDITTIRFPSIKLERRDAHKLRGFVANQFSEITELHNHLDDNTNLHAYPVVQYKVLDGVPTLVGIGRGSRILMSLIDKIENIDIDGRVLPVTAREINTRNVSIGVGDRVQYYRFDNAWMALNTRNFTRYTGACQSEQIDVLRRILVGNILVFLGAFNEFADREVIAVPKVQTSNALFKGLNMMTFRGSFQTNVLLPDGIGLGKCAARGFGAIRRDTEPFRTTTRILRPRYRCGRPIYSRSELAR